MLAVNVRGPQFIMLTIADVNQDIDTILKQDKSEGAMAPLGPIVAMPVARSVICRRPNQLSQACNMPTYRYEMTECTCKGVFVLISNKMILFVPVNFLISATFHFILTPICMSIIRTQVRIECYTMSILGAIMLRLV